MKVSDKNLPRFFTPGAGEELTQFARPPGGTSVALNLPHSVDDALALYRDSVEAADFDVVMSENEGFEGELYFRGKGKVGAVRVRSSFCDHASSVLVTLVRTKAL